MLYMDRRRALIKAIHMQRGDMLEVIGAEAGMHLVALLPLGANDVAVSRQVAPPARGGLILGYGGANSRQIYDGIGPDRITPPFGISCPGWLPTCLLV
jgi:GntR family transcriptional regulator/MocR family aminotransferase